MPNCHKILLAGIYHILYLAFIIRNIFGLIFLVESSLWERDTGIITYITKELIKVPQK